MEPVFFDGRLPDTPPQQIIDMAFSPGEFDRAGRYRIYELCNFIEKVLNGTIKIK